MKISSATLPVTPSWQRLGARSAADLSSAEAREAESSADSQRLRDMREALARLKVSPAAPKSNKQEAIAKASWLKQRLEELKAMLMYASPEQARALARELKDIAGQLGAVARSASGGGSGQSAVAGVVDAINGATATPDAASADTASAQAAASTEAVAAKADAEATTAAGETIAAANTAANAPADAAGKPASDKEKGETKGTEKSSAAQGSDDDKSLRKILEEARKLLKQTIAMLKSKLSQSGPEAQADIQAAEKGLASLDAAMASGSTDIGSTISATVNDAISGEISSAIGTNIDVTA